MAQLKFTTTAHSFFKPEQTPGIIANIILARERIAQPPGNRDTSITGGHLTTWRLSYDQLQLTSRIFYDTDDQNPINWFALDIGLALFPNTVVTDVPEEHRTFIIYEGEIWTLGDLAVREPMAFPGLDIWLTRDAWLRVHHRQNAAAAVQTFESSPS
jgi:hypothetical protein